MFQHTTIIFAQIRLTETSTVFIKQQETAAQMLQQIEILSIVTISILFKARPENKRKKVLSGLRGKIHAEPQEVNS